MFLEDPRVFFACDNSSQTENMCLYASNRSLTSDASSWSYDMFAKRPYFALHSASTSGVCGEDDSLALAELILGIIASGLTAAAPLSLALTLFSSRFSATFSVLFSRFA